jgi:hypothetical protein
MMAWQVGPVQDTDDGSGFNIFDATQRPMRIVTFGYLSPAEAAKARDLMVEVLKNAKHVSAHA